jgi:DNA polymerase-3 subunit alpha
VPSQFVHLHLHTQYSLLDGANQIDPLIKQVKTFGMPAVAITDHGNMFGAVEFYQKAQAAGVKPILGCEAYMAPRSRTDRDGALAHNDYYHLILLARNRTGYQNLIKLVSKAYLEGFYYKPRMDKELLQQHHEGLIALSGCLSGEVPYLISQKDMDGAIRAAGEYREIFGADQYYLEVQTNGLEHQRVANRGLVEIHNKLGIPLAGTNDCHYLKKEDARPHDVMLCLQTGKTLNDPNRMRFDTDQLYVKSSDEMASELIELPQAVLNTCRIADDCDLNLTFNKSYLPQYQVPETYTRETYLKELAVKGLAARLRERPSHITSEAYELRLREELTIIMTMGYAGYFLIVWDIIKFARSRGIPVGPGRGSAAGSLVAYALRITDIDPLVYHLLFERFLNPERVTMPDIDMDFCMDRRNEVINYVIHKYGEDHVCQIITFGTMGAKAVIRDVGRVMEIPYAEVDRVAKLVPSQLNITLEDALAQEPRLRELTDSDPKIAELMTTARALEGLARHASTHAAGVVISDEPLTNHVPLYRGANEEVVTQYPMGDVEKIGLVKFDFLGLKTLTMIHHAVRLVNDLGTPSGTAAQAQDSGREPLDFGRLPLDDKDTYALLASGRTTGIFQLESPGMRNLLTRIKPECFEDLVAILALYRPGPLESGMVEDFIKRKRDPSQISYDPPGLEPILRDTYGVIVYQEQVMAIANRVAGFSLGQADLLRRAMGKKKPEEMEKQKALFIQGAKANQLPEKKAEKLFDLMAYFAGYGFNRCVIGETALLDAFTGESTTVRDLFAAPHPFTVHALGPDQRLHPRPVIGLVSNGRKPVFEMRTILGKHVTATGNHPFLTLNGWKNLEELKPGDRIAVPRRLEVGKGEPWPKHEIIALAGLLSEGNTCHPTCLYFFGNDPVLVDDFADAGGRFPNTVARKYARGDGRLEVCLSTGRDTRFKKGTRPWNFRNLGGEDTFDVNGASRTNAERPLSGAYRWAEQLGILGCRATHKRMPGPVFRMQDPDLELFLGRLWAGDGFIANEVQTVPFYATSSAQLARDVQTLLLRLGIVSRIHDKRFKYRGGWKLGYTVTLLGEHSIETFVRRILPHCLGRDKQAACLIRHRESTARGLTSKDTVPPEVRRWVDEERRRIGMTWNDLEVRSGVSMKEFYGKGSHAKQGFRRSTLLKVGAFLGSRRIQDLATSDVFWDRIVDIEPRGEQETYDLTVEEHANFVADGVIVHNSHSAAYALVTYQTAYLKAHYPTQCLAALLTSEMGNADKMVGYFAECRELGIRILPPDVNESQTDFTVVEGGIRFGLAAIKNVGEGAVDSIIATRNATGRFRSFADFCHRIEIQKVNKRVLEGLIKVGAFDSTKARRAQLMAVLESTMDVAASAHREREQGQTSIFGDPAEGSASNESHDAPLPDVPEWDQGQILKFERELTGFYITAHPLARYEAAIRKFATTGTDHISEVADGKEVRLCGIINSVKPMVTKKGDRMAYFQLEDLSGLIEIIAFPDLYQNAGTLIVPESVVRVTGTVDRAEKGTRLKGTRVESLTELLSRSVKQVNIRLKASEASDHLQQLQAVLQRHPGPTALYLTLSLSPELEADTGPLPNITVLPSELFVTEVEELLGKGAVALL